MKKLNLIKKSECYRSIIDINEDDIAMDFFKSSSYNIGIRGSYEFIGKALWLDHDYDYAFGEDSHGEPILVPLKKK